MLEPNPKYGLFIPNRLYEHEVTDSLRRYLSIQNALNVEPPVLIFLDLFGVKGYTMGIERGRVAGKGVRKAENTVLTLNQSVRGLNTSPFLGVSLNPHATALKAILLVRLNTREGTSSREKSSVGSFG